MEQDNIMQSYIETYLEDNSLSKLDILIERAIERIAYRKTEKYQKEFKEFLMKLLKETPKSSNFKIINANTEDIIQLEKGCLMLNKLSKRKNLTHLERTSLLFTYMRFGNNGERRLRQIMEQQDNYKEKITEQQINQVKNKKRLGISCEKMIEWCVCCEKDCKNYKKINSKVK